MDEFRVQVEADSQGVYGFGVRLDDMFITHGLIGIENSETDWHQVGPAFSLDVGQMGYRVKGHLDFCWQVMYLLV